MQDTSQIPVGIAAICAYILGHHYQYISPPSIWHPSHYPTPGRRAHEQGEQSASPMPAPGSLEEKCRILNTHKEVCTYDSLRRGTLLVIPHPQW